MYIFICIFLNMRLNIFFDFINLFFLMSPINLIDFGSFFDIFLDYQFDVFVLQLVTFVDIINVKNDCINLIVPNLF